MTSTEAKAVIFWTAFRALSKKDKEAFMRKLMDDRELRDDLIDTAIMDSRRRESSRSLEDYIEERKKIEKSDLPCSSEAVCREGVGQSTGSHP